MENTSLVNQATGEVVDFNSGGASQMAAMLAEMESKLNLVQIFFKRVMSKDTDYGIIPGTDKPSLLKPGAEKLLALYNFASVIKEKNETRDLKTGYYQAQIVVQIIHRGTGVVVAEGVGEASSFESKYRYRWMFESDVPDSVDKNSLISKTFESKKGKQYKRYRMENPDLIDQWNTVLKMAKKRALVDATLAATGTSGIFTQSETEMEEWLEAVEGEKKEKLEKVRSTPAASDEKGTFTPQLNGKITDAQKNKIFGDASRKGIDAEGIRSIVQLVKEKSLDDLSKADASAVIDFIAKTDEEGMQDLLMEAAMGKGESA